MISCDILIIKWCPYWPNMDQHGLVNLPLIGKGQECISGLTPSPQMWPRPHTRRVTESKKSQK